MSRVQSAFLFLVFGLALQGCTVSHKEIRHLKSSGDSPNYFRVEVKTNALMTKSTYSSGFYDERALDIFLNEQSTSTDNSVSEVTTTEVADAEPNEKSKKSANIQTVNSQGVYAYIFSTNADAIASTIGAFAENQVVADHIVALLNRGKLERMAEEDLRIEMGLSQSSSVRAELEALVNAIPDDQSAAPNGTVLSSYYNLLNAIARALGSNKRFDSLESAREFFDGMAAK